MSTNVLEAAQAVYPGFGPHEIQRAFATATEFTVVTKDDTGDIAHGASS
jgi:hypothetical protein